MSDEFLPPSGDAITDRKRMNRQKQVAGSSFTKTRPMSEQSAMTYEELKREITRQPKSHLPGLLLHVARLCGIYSVFKDKEVMLEIVGHYYDMGPDKLAKLKEQPAQPEAREKALLPSRDGSWMDQWGACKICGGEIHHGHTNNCDIYKMECRIRQCELRSTGQPNLTYDR